MVRFLPHSPVALLQAAVNHGGTLEEVCSETAPPRVALDPQRGAWIEPISADHAPEVSDRAMYQETTRSSLRQMSASRPRASQISFTTDISLTSLRTSSKRF